MLYKIWASLESQLWTHLDNCKLHFIIEFDLPLRVHHLTEMEEHSGIPVDAADETETILDGGDGAHLTFFSTDLERILHQGDIGGPLKLVTAISGNVELHYVIYIQRVLSLLVLITVWYLYGPASKKGQLVHQWSVVNRTVCTGFNLNVELKDYWI